MEFEVLLSLTRVPAARPRELAFAVADSRAAMRAHSGPRLTEFIRRRWKAGLVAFLAVALAYLPARRLIPRRYEAEAWVRYQMPPQKSGADDVATLLRTEIHAANSDRVAAGAACHASLVLGTQLVQFRIVARNPMLAAAIANRTAEQFVARCRDGQPLPHAESAGNRRSAGARAQALVRALEQERSLLPPADDGTDAAIRAGQLAALATRAEELERRRDELDLACASARAEVDRWTSAQRSAISNASTASAVNGRDLTDAEEKDAAYQAAAAEEVSAFKDYSANLARGKTEEHPDVILAKARLTRAEAEAAAQKQRLAASLAADVEAERHEVRAEALERARRNLAVAEARQSAGGNALREIGQQLSQARHEDSAARGIQRQARDLDAQIAAAIAERDGLADRLSHAEEAEKSTTPAEFFVSRRAQAAAAPVHEAAFFLSFLSIAIAMSVFSALIAERADPRLRGASDAERLLGAPVLGELPPLQALALPSGGRARAVLASAIRQLRDRLLADGPRDGCSLTGVVSPGHTDGKNSVATALAISLARVGWRVLLIDCDIQRPTLHQAFGADLSPGVVELIAGAAEPSSAIRRSPHAHLDMLPAGYSSKPGIDLLSGPEMGVMLQAFSRIYDHVIVTASQAHGDSTALPLLGRMTRIVCVVGNASERDAVRSLRTCLNEIRARIIGVILSGL